MGYNQLQEVESQLETLAMERELAGLVTEEIETDKPDFSKMAFPITDETGKVIDNGMTLLDWFAGQALAGILANADKPVADRCGNLPAENERRQVQDAYTLAELMMAERIKPNERINNQRAKRNEQINKRRAELTERLKNNKRIM